MSDKVQCLTHGEAEATYVCRHIVDSLDTREAVGFHWPADTDLSRPDAWCSECELVRRSEGDWTDTAMEFVQVTTLCGGCYDRAKAIWLGPRAS
jgi:hypothetical protein